jgi:hypothetical protein
MAVQRMEHGSLLREEWRWHVLYGTLPTIILTRCSENEK